MRRRPRSAEAPGALRSTRGWDTPGLGRPLRRAGGGDGVRCALPACAGLAHWRGDRRRHARCGAAGPPALLGSLAGVAVGGLVSCPSSGGGGWAARRDRRGRPARSRSRRPVIAGPPPPPSPARCATAPPPPPGARGATGRAPRRRRPARRGAVAHDQAPRGSRPRRRAAAPTGPRYVYVRVLIASPPPAETAHGPAGRARGRPARPGRPRRSSPTCSRATRPTSRLGPRSWPPRACGRGSTSAARATPGWPWAARLAGGPSSGRFPTGRGDWAQGAARSGRVPGRRDPPRRGPVGHQAPGPTGSGGHAGWSAGLMLALKWKTFSGS